VREGGCTAAQELAFTLADGIAYVEAALAAGLEADGFGGRVSFFFGAHNDLFEEAAKFRAARRMWARIMRERFGARKERTMMLRFHTQTCGSTLTAQQADNNIARVTVQTLAAVLGGTQSLHTNSRDEALGLPTEESVRIALRTQQIAAYESGAAWTADPLAGSYYVEALTDRLEAEAWGYIEKIDGMGGAVEAIERGYIQREIAESAYRYQMEIEAGTRVVVGVNRFKSEGEVAPAPASVGAGAGEAQRAKLERLRATRDGARARAALRALGEAARGTENLMPTMLECARAYCTIGEISDALRVVFGEYRPMEVI